MTAKKKAAPKRRKVASRIVASPKVALPLLPLNPYSQGPSALAQERKGFEGPAPRIARIKMKGFRGFANEDYVFDLTDKGKSLLLYGENGSGKSSVFRALAGILNDQRPQFHKEQNIFFPSSDDYVAVEWTNGTPSDLTWQVARIYPQNDQMGRVHELARRVTLLSYKDLLRLHLEDIGRHRVDIFNLLVDKLLRYVELPSGPTVFRRFVELKHIEGPRLQEALTSKKRKERDEAQEVKPTFLAEVARSFDELDQLLSVGEQCIVVRANQLLKYMVPGLEISVYSEARKEDKNSSMQIVDVDLRKYHLACRYWGETVKHPGFFLNEGRLTAIALSLYLAGAERSLPSGGDDKTRILVLDDVLIGLDMSHRIPMLKLLREEFAEWQVLLFTHDRVWYDLACSYTRGEDQWVHMEVTELDAGPERPMRPYLRQGQDHLERAKQLLGIDNDRTAAAVHIRAWFEDLIKRKCEKFNLKLHYHEDAKNYKADKFWQELKDDVRPIKGAATKMGSAVIAEVEMVRSNVLNKLSHAGSVNLVKADVQQALELMPRLKAALEKP